MKRNKKKYPKCPSCNQDKHRTEMKIAISDMEKIDKAQYKHYKELKMETYGGFVDSNFEWACDACLDSKKAIKANPSLQNYSWNPHYAYSDSEITCSNCNTEFTFSKEEKKHWLEVLKFWVDSTPVNCLNCRKEIRKLKAENKTLSEILKKEESEISVSELEKIVEIYTKWEKNNRVKYYQSILRKRKS